MAKLLKYFVFILLLVTFLKCGNSKVVNLTELLNKLEGTWQLENSNTFEIWEKQDSFFIGQVVKIENGDTTIEEHLRILKTEETIFYEATVLTQNNGLPVRFKLIQFDENEFTFINNKHDFPKKIIYNLQYDKTLQATISGNDKSISFKYTKIE